MATMPTCPMFLKCEGAKQRLHTKPYRLAKTLTMMFDHANKVETSICMCIMCMSGVYAY